MPVVTPIYLNEEESKRFLLYMQHFDLFQKLLDSDIASIMEGSFTVHVAQGKVRMIEKNKIVRF